MNKNIYRVIFNAARGLWTAVQETATGIGKGRSVGTTRRAPFTRARTGFVDMLSMRHVAFAALCALGMQPLWADAQVVVAPTAGSRPAVGVTANGLPIVQIATPNGAGVSNNTYTHFGVGPSGLILNNSGSNVQTQLGGYVTGNPNLAAGSARVIVNQVVGGNPSQLLGYTEVAGQRAEVVIANPAGIYCNGCGFINTSRGILTTGTPVFGGTGSLDAFHVTGGQIQIGAAGLNGSNVDQVDLIARSVAVNGKLWAGQSLNVVTGNNEVRHADLNTQSLGADGNSPGVAIDVAQLGGMYANKIMLVGTEKGVGVNSAGTIASQAGDVQISSQGKVTLSGSTGANGNLLISAAGDVANSGAVYATQSAALNSQGQVTNSGTVAALGNTTVAGASVNSTGALGAGLDANGNVTGTGSLAVTGTAGVTATGQQMAGGNLTLSGSSLNMAGGQTLAKGNASLTATGAGGDTGNIDHTGASLQAADNLTVDAAGGLTNDHGQIGAAQLSVTAGGISNRGGTLSQTGAGDTTLAAAGAFDNTGGTVTTNAQNAALRSGSLTNVNGTISQVGTGALNVQTGALDNRHGNIVANSVATIAATSLQNGAGSITSVQALNVASSGDIDNTSGQLEAAGAMNVSGANVQNTAGRIVSRNGDGLTLTASGEVTNAAGTTAQGATGGVIGGNGNTAIQAASLTNSGTITAAQNLAVTASASLDNSGGSMSGATLQAKAASLRNANGTISADTVSVTAPQFDNSSGTITANQIDVSATNLTNQRGSITQIGTGPMSLGVSSTLDNSNGGLIQTNSTDLTLAPATLNNNGGTVTHAGTGTLSIDAANGTGALTNVNGSIVSNGQVVLNAGGVDDTGGTIGGQSGLNATIAGALNNTGGQLKSNGSLSVTSGSAITNTNGTIAASGDNTVRSDSLTNGGSITAGRNLNATVSGTLDNSSGTLSGQTVTANAASLKNANGVVSANAVSMSIAQLDNSGGRIIANQLGVTATNLTNQQGSITQLGTGPMSLGVSSTLDNSNGGLIQTNSTDLKLAPSTLNNNGGTITHAGTGTLTIDAGNQSAGALTNVGGKIVTHGDASLSVGSLDNTGGSLASQGVMSATVQGTLNNTNGQLSSGTGLTATSGGELINTRGVIGAGGAVSGSTLSLSAASIDNSNGAITNVGTGATTLNGGSQISNNNAGGVSGMGSISGNGDVTVNATSLSNTQGGQLSGANLQINAGNLDNTGGAIGNVANTTGDIGIATSTLTGTSGQIGASRNLSIAANTLVGGGAYSAVNDLSLNLQGDFATSPNYRFNAGHNLNFTLPGTFSNSGAMSASNGLNINAGDIQNSGALAAGGLLTTHSNTLTNTGTIVGGSVSLNATQTLSNLGPSALIGATDSAGTLELLAPDIENRDDTTATDTQATTAIYGLGKVVLAGGKDANGNYVKANLIRNQSALIQSSGDMEVDATLLTNTRRVMTTTGLTSSVDPTVLTNLGISLSGCTAIYMAACSGQSVGWVSKGDPTLIGGAFIEPPHGGQWNSGYQYTTYTGVAVASTISSISPQSQIVAGGNLNASSVGMLQNYWSQVAATGNIVSPFKLDQESWQGQNAPQVQVTYSGQYHYNNYDNSEHNWQLPFGDAPFVTSNPGGFSQAAPADVRTYALPGYESTYTAHGTISGTGVTINNTAGNAGVTPLGLLPGQTVSDIGAGSVSGTIGTAGGAHAGPVAFQGGHIVNSGLPNSSNPTIAAATAVKVLNNITVPTGGLFSPNTAPNAPYLVETNPAFTNQKQWLSSDYYFQQMGMNPGQIQMRLGDGFYEQKLVQDQILSMTGKSVLTNYASNQDEFQALMTSGASLAKSLDLAPGTGLSPAQVAQLTSNVVIMQAQVVDGQSVLVPVVYLAQTSQQNMGNGPVIAATNIDLQNAQGVTNSGTIAATNSFAISGQSIDSSFGVLQSGGQMSLVTTGDVNLTSATVNAGSLALQTGGNLVLNTAVNTFSQVSDSGATRVTTVLGPAASVNVTGNAAIVTGGNFEQNAGALNVGGALGMSIGGNWDLGAQVTGETKVVARANGISDTQLVSATGSSVKVGGVSTIAVSGDLTATGATLNLNGGGTLAAKGSMTLQAATATSTVDSNSSGSDHHGSYSESLHTSDDVVTGTVLKSGDSLNIVSGKDINIAGSDVYLSKGNATLAAVGDVNIGAATQTNLSNSQQSGSHSGVMSSTSIASTRNDTSTQSIGSSVSADGVTISSGHDLNVKGSTIAGTNDVSLSATHDVNITTTQDTMESSGTYEEHHSGLMAGGGIAVSVGSSKMASTDQESSVTNNASTIGTLNGNLTVQAGNTLHVSGSDLIAGKNLTGTAADVIIDSVTDTSHQAQTQQTSKSGLTLGLSGSVGDAINNAISETQATRHSAQGGDDRASALHAIAAAGDVGMVAAAGKDLMKGGQAPSIGIQISLGSSHSSSQSSEDQTTQRGSSVQAGGTATFVATGGGSAGSGNVTIAGSDVNATDVALIAKNQVNLLNTTNTDSTRSSNSSSSASVGVSIGTSGVGISASMQNAHGDGNSDASMQNNTHINASGSATIISGGDTHIVGANVNANQVAATIGGNLNIASVQDTTNSAAHQSSAGGGFSISQGGGNVSFSAQSGHADGSYAGVAEQAGIRAGSGGFDVNVKGNTDLKGAVIASEADASKNTLTTGTLTYSDIENHSHYSAASNGIGAGLGVGVTQKAVGPSSVSGSGGVTPMISQDENGDENATTRSAIGAGTINVTNGASQTQDVAGLSRDTTGTNGSVSKTPDVQNILSQQSDLMNAAQAAGQTVAQGIGAYADKKRGDAATAVEAAYERGDMQAMATALADYNNWSEGGDSRAVLQAAGGMLIGGLGGGAFGAVGGAAGAAISSKMAGLSKALGESVGDATGSTLIGNISGNILSGLAGGLIGGSAGAAMASNVNLYNQNGDATEGSDNARVKKILDQALGKPDLSAMNNVSLSTMINQFIGLIKAGAKAKMSESPTDLAAQGVANGWVAVSGVGSGKPPLAGPKVATAGSGAAADASLNPTVGTPGYVPGNATINSGNSDQSLGGKSVSDLSDAAKSPDPSDKSGELSAAGRGLQKHGSRDDSAFPAAKGNPAAINEQGQKIVDEILNDPARTVEQLNRGRYGDVIEVRASDGRGIRYGADGKFIGFLEPDK
ncbi:hemagglutinin repeat-containing protein [Paraburkholderia xenovorans]|uniref:two-partner secretion domain-containing protein n=1 Tax=Paraburkholderia xenovorans TaxID=36873 RepID=UPI0038B7AF45